MTNGKMSSLVHRNLVPGVRFHGRRADGDLDGPLPGRLLLAERPPAPVQLAPAPHDHRAHLPLRKW